MPQTNKKEEWVQFYKKQLKVFLGKKSGWYVSKSAGSIKLEVITNGKKESRTLPYKWNEQEFAVAVEEIKQIYKRYQEGKVHTLAAACNITVPAWPLLCDDATHFRTGKVCAVAASTVAFD